MARKNTEITFLTRAQADFVPLLKEVRDWDNGGILTGYRIMDESGKVQLGTVSASTSEVPVGNTGKVRKVVTWTAQAGGKGTGFPRKTVQQPTRAKAIMASLPGSYNAS